MVCAVHLKIYIVKMKYKNIQFKLPIQVDTGKWYND